MAQLQLRRGHWRRRQETLAVLWRRPWKAKIKRGADPYPVSRNLCPVRPDLCRICSICSICSIFSSCPDLSSLSLDLCLVSPDLSSLSLDLSLVSSSLSLVSSNLSLLCRCLYPASVSASVSVSVSASVSASVSISVFVSVCRTRTAHKPALGRKENPLSV